MNYVERDVPDGMTLIQWRRMHHRPAAGAKRRWLRLLRGRAASFVTR